MNGPRLSNRLAIGYAMVLMLIRTAHGQLQRFVYEKAEMGVPFRITLYAETEELAKSAADAAFARVEVLNSILSDYDPDSELSKLSRSSGQGLKVPVTSDLWNVLSLGQAMARKS